MLRKMMRMLTDVSRGGVGGGLSQSGVALQRELRKFDKRARQRRIDETTRDEDEAVRGSSCQAQIAHAMLIRRMTTIQR